MDKKRAEMVELPPTTVNFLFYATPAMAYVSLLWSLSANNFGLFRKCTELVEKKMNIDMSKN